MLPHHEDLRRRWDRIGIGVRCAYNPWLPPVILLYLQAGRRLVTAGVMDDETVQRRMLSLLMHTAADEALPWTWRAACLEHTVRPRARLARLLAERDPAEVDRMEREVGELRERLDAALLTGRCVPQRLGG
ncbi:MAG: FagA protein [Burkholderiaceae bacterium]|nr:FagA protein [Burkholderiaceae bacterium]